MKKVLKNFAVIAIPVLLMISASACSQKTIHTPVDDVKQETGIVSHEKTKQDVVATFLDGEELTWRELKRDRNGKKYGYDASLIDDSSIGWRAFKDCNSLVSISIPNGVTLIKYNAFENCQNLTSVKLSNSVVDIHQEVFKNCTSLETIELPNKITSICDHLFNGCSSLASITMPDSVTSIGIGAFSGCSSLTNIDIPANVNEIWFAFPYCTSLNNINVDPNNKTFTSIDGVLYSKDMQMLLEYPGGRTKATICNQTKIIKSYAFRGCENLSQITLPDGLECVGGLAFEDCISLEAITFPNSVKDIQDGVFENCRSLKHVVLPNELETVSQGLFYGCESLKEIDIPESVTTIDAWPFRDSGVTSIFIPKNVTRIAEQAFCENDRLVEIIVDDENQTYAALNGVLYTKDMKTLVQACGGIANANIPNGVETINKISFYLSPNIKSVQFPNTLVSIGEYAFFWSPVTEIYLPDGLTSLGTGVFQHCDLLTQVRMPNSIKQVPESAFARCYQLSKIIFDGTMAEWNNIVFGDWWHDDCPEITVECIDGTLIIPEDVNYRPLNF